MAQGVIGDVARSWHLGVEDTFDRMMLVLWDALFLRQSEEWSHRGYANTTADETLDLARWFLRGQKVGAKPLFDGMCSFCGTLLHGDINQRSRAIQLTVIYVHLEGRPGVGHIVM